MRLRGTNESLVNVGSTLQLFMFVRRQDEEEGVLQTPGVGNIPAKSPPGMKSIRFNQLQAVVFHAQPQNTNLSLEFDEATSIPQ